MPKSKKKKKELCSKCDREAICWIGEAKIPLCEVCLRDILDKRAIYRLSREDE